MKKIFELFSVDKYFKMDNHQLEIEASKYKIGGYANDGRIVRERIIEQLLKKDEVNNSRYAVFISLLALVLSTISILFRFI